jgi:hypothetical protein
MQWNAIGRNITMGQPHVMQWENGCGSEMAGKVVYFTTINKRMGARGMWQMEWHGMWYLELGGKQIIFISTKNHYYSSYPWHATAFTIVSLLYLTPLTLPPPPGCPFLS